MSATIAPPPVMLSYHGDSAIKEKYLARVAHHRELDHLTQGIGWETRGDQIKGCAVGCTLENYDHSRYPIELGLPQWLAHLEDHIFEALSVEESKEWPEQFLAAIPVGVPESAFTAVRDRFQIFWLERQRSQIDAAKFPDIDAAIVAVIVLLQQALDGSEPEAAAWSAARAAAEAAAWSAAWSAARAAAWSAAWSAARAAAEAAAWSAAWSAKHSEARLKRDWLLAELKSLTPAEAAA